MDFNPGIFTTDAQAADWAAETLSLLPWSDRQKDALPGCLRVPSLQADNRVITTNGPTLAADLTAGMQVPTRDHGVRTILWTHHVAEQSAESIHVSAKALGQPEDVDTYTGTGRDCD